MAEDMCQGQSLRFQQEYNPLKLRRNPTQYASLPGI